MYPAVLLIPIFNCQTTKIRFSKSTNGFLMEGEATNAFFDVNNLE